MEKNLAEKLVRYYATPGDASVSEKFEGWTEEDFAALEEYLDAHQPTTWEEAVALERNLAAGIL